MSRDNVNSDEMKRAAQENRLNEYLSSHLSSDTLNKLNSVLSDERKTKELLNSQKAQEIMRKLKRDK
ncbi:MAG: hypothetical protein J5964_06325 [Eubacterium sp.]|nr:hypothetical protein [Eubacterium sp.]